MRTRAEIGEIAALPVNEISHSSGSPESIFIRFIPFPPMRGGWPPGEVNFFKLPGLLMIFHLFQVVQILSLNGPYRKS